MPDSSPSNRDLLALFLDPEIRNLPALAQRTDLPLADLLIRLLDPAFQALLEAVEALEAFRAEVLARQATHAALEALATIARTSPSPVEARRAATTILTHTRRPTSHAHHSSRRHSNDSPTHPPRPPAERSTRDRMNDDSRTANPRARHHVCDDPAAASSRAGNLPLPGRSADASVRAPRADNLAPCAALSEQRNWAVPDIHTSCSIGLSRVGTGSSLHADLHSPLATSPLALDST
ncbi:MAG: hypothetical protein H6811_09890 [Phycisphaeraceae bacterium]|nr:hypothetical protein [Phycisphaeraceae bacterium]